eukprot:1521373-Rhodomonas_salina.1
MPGTDLAHATRATKTTPLQTPPRSPVSPTRCLVLTFRRVLPAYACPTRCPVLPYRMPATTCRTPPRSAPILGCTAPIYGGTVPIDRDTVAIDSDVTAIFSAAAAIHAGGAALYGDVFGAAAAAIYAGIAAVYGGGSIIHSTRAVLTRWHVRVQFGFGDATGVLAGCTRVLRHVRYLRSVYDAQVPLVLRTVRTGLGDNALGCYGRATRCPVLS